MPLQNRVLPSGEIVADPARGLVMGNRGGCLHDDHRRLKQARWKGRTWIVCVLEFKGRRRQVMAPGQYTELFFLDEAVAFAAGHRPCAECRRADYNTFRAAIGYGSAPEMDAVLHAARLDGHGQRRYRAQAAGLPDGVFIDHGGPHLLCGDALYPYAPAGYGAPLPRPVGEVVVMTPEPTVAALRAGYRPVMAI